RGKDMEEKAIIAVRDCAEGSEEGRLTFPEVLARLASVGIERYRVDFARGEKTFYGAGGESHVLAGRKLAPGNGFSSERIAAAVKASQAKQIDYKTFCAEIV